MVERVFHFIAQVSPGWKVTFLLYHPKLGDCGYVTPHLAIVIKRLAAWLFGYSWQDRQRLTKYTACLTQLQSSEHTPKARLHKSLFIFYF